MNSANLTHIVGRFPHLRILVIGDAMLDRYLCGPSERLCREAPVPIVDINSEISAAGGAANTAINLRTMGAHVTFLSVVGGDEDGRRLRSILQEQGIDTEPLIAHRLRRTLSKHRIVANGHLLVRYDLGDVAPLAERLEAQLMHSLNHLVPEVDAVVVSDYGYGVLSPRVIARLSKVVARQRRLLIVDAKYPERYRQAGASAIKPNYGEAVKLLGLKSEAEPAARIKQIQRRSPELLRRTGAQMVAVTLDNQGALLFERSGLQYRTYAQPQPDSRAAGAGDTFTSALALALAAGAHGPAAAEIASAAAAIVVARDGTTSCSLTELKGSLQGNSKVLVNHQGLEDQVRFLREQEKRIVFTNGCFDILHRGHISYLSQAKELGDVLIVGLNSDESVRRLKGNGPDGPRPINCLEDRAQVLAAMSCVDYIVPFTEDTPRRLIEKIQPDIYVKGGDYTREQLPEAPLVEALGGEVHLLPYLDTFSTTGIIERIRSHEAPANGHGERQWPQLVSP